MNILSSLRRLLEAVRAYWQRSFRRQMMVGFGASALLLMLVAGHVLHQQQRDALYREGVQSAIALASTLSKSSTSLVLANDVSGLQEVVSGLSGTVDLKRAFVLAPNGEVLASTQANEIGLSVSDALSLDLLKSAPDKQVLVDQQNLIDVAVPVMSGTRHVGWVRVEQTRDSANAALHRLGNVWLGFTLFAILLVVLVALLLARNLMKGLNHLMGVASEVERGHREVRASVLRGDELGVLARDFNHMLDALAHEKVLLRSVIDSLPDLIFFKDSNSVYLGCNKAFEQYAGRPESEQIGKTDFDFFDPATAEFFRDKDRRMMESGHAVSNEEWVNYPDGRNVLLDTIKTPFHSADGTVLGLVGISRDITERKQNEQRIRNLNRVYAVLSNINQAIVRMSEPAELFDAACRIAVNDGQFKMAWIGVPDHEHKLMRVAAQAGMTRDYLDNIHISLLDDEFGRGPTGIAYREGQHAFCNDIEYDPRLAPWREKLLDLGFRSSVSLPIKVQGNVRATFTCYVSETNFFNEQEIKLLDEMASDVGFALEVWELNQERQRAEDRLRQSAAVFENTREGVLVTDTELRITMVNRAFCDITGYAEQEVLGLNPSLLASGQHDRDFFAAIWSDIKSAGHWQGEIWNRRKNGEVYPELLSISAVKNELGQPVNYVGVFTDISKLKASEERLDFLAHHDPLTRLPNRLLMNSRLEHAIEFATREKRKLALLVIDLDRFKDVNDSYGHAIGDELLQQVADRLATRLRSVDTLTRLGGDEFTVLLESIVHEEDAARVANIIIAALCEPWWLSNGVQVSIGASIGISLFPEHGASAAELFQHADAALYRAKAEGRGRYKYFTEAMTHNARERIDMESRLHDALDWGDLRVYYQPQVDIASDRIVGAEALVRWQDKQRGLVPPDQFIPIAEETGLIGRIGEFVLRETCLQGKRWLDAGHRHLTLAVNLSPRQILRDDINALVNRVLAETGFPASSLELELTESALMEREEETIATLNRLRAIGVRLAIDDFGTGYSSLSYLKRFPLDVLKIDKSFVDDIPLQQDDMEIAATIISMGHTLGFKVLAEGVETAAQLDFLTKQGCDLYQGYLRSEPLTAEGFEQLLKSAQ